MKVRVRFEKDGNLRYIGHLDIMRFFHKAFQRAKIDVKFSEGFHPHPVMSFASPLSVGLSSCGEYLDTELNTRESSGELVRRLNAVMTEGIRVTQFRELPEGGKRRENNAMALVGLADYRVTVRTCPVPPEGGWEAAAERFLAQPEIRILRKTKHREEETDIRPWIRTFAVLPAEDAAQEGPSFCLRLSAGSEANLKPETVLEAFFRYMGREDCFVTDAEGNPVRDLWLDICRLDLLTAEGISLGDLGRDFDAQSPEASHE